MKEALVERNSLILHAASFAKGIGNEKTNSLGYLQRLEFALREDLELSCSTFGFGDSFSKGDIWGQVGLILFPKSPDSITLVSPCDGGTSIDPDNFGRRVHPRDPITKRAIVESMDQRAKGSTNEWCLLAYDALGIYVEPPIQYSEGSKILDIDLSEVFEAFPEQKVYGFIGKQLFDVQKNGSVGSNISAIDFYSRVN